MTTRGDVLALALPDELEVCARRLDGLRPCGGLIWRPTPDVPHCWKCGGNDPGVRYVRGDRAPAPLATFWPCDCPECVERKKGGRDDVA